MKDRGNKHSTHILIGVIVINAIVSLMLLCYLRIYYFDFLSGVALTVFGIILTSVVFVSFYRKAKASIISIKCRRLFIICCLVPSIALIINCLCLYLPILIFPDEYYASDHKSIWPIFQFIIEMM